ncbi:MAG: putative ABC transport system permease protein [Halothiobacillaceae bacterium]|nr:MAG: putative ABC transport system permease protein [Halothiobacillaceae bacterium]
MRSADVTSFALRTVTHQRLRSFLTALGIAVGIAAVVLLTSIGEGIHQFVLKEFTQFGTNIVAINPGRSTTQGTPLGILGSVRPLSLEDAAALKNSPLISESVPSFQGNAEVEAVGKQRRVTVFGTSAAMAQAFTLQVSRGQFLPPDDATAPRAFAVLGAKTAKELFGNQNPLGERLRVGGDRFRVVGVMAPKGTVLGFDMDDTVFIPAARAQELFNREGLFEIDVIYRDKSSRCTWWHFAGGGGHRHLHHHDHCRHRTYERDRSVAGDRCHPSADHAAALGRSGHPLCPRRPFRAALRWRWRLSVDALHPRPARPHPLGVSPTGGIPCDWHWPAFRYSPRPPSGALRPSGGIASGVAAQVSCLRCSTNRVTG